MPTLSFTPSQGSANRRGQRGRPGRHGSASFGQSTNNLISQPLSTSRRSAPPPVIIIPQEGWPDLGRTERPLCCAHECWQGWATGGRATAARLRAVSSCRAARGTGRAHALFVCRGHKHILHARGAWGVRQVRAPPREGRTSFRLGGPGIFGHRPARPREKTKDVTTFPHRDGVPLWFTTPPAADDN